MIDFVFKQSLSFIVLVAANLVPLIGVLFFQWDHTLVIALFWIENLIIGAFNIVRMITAMVVNKLRSIFHPIFFLFHYGIFCAVHGSFLWKILELGDLPPTVSLFGWQAGGIFELFAEGATVLMAFIEMHSPIIWLGIASLLLSRLVSFIEHFLLRGEVFDSHPKDLMAKPYGQIVIMHAGIILGAAAIDQFGSSVWLLVIIVAFKLVVDCVQHVKRHKHSENVKIN